MKRELYDLTDEPFLMFVNRVGTVLSEEQISYNIVGGVAVQSYLLSMLAKKHSADVQALIKNPEVRVQDYIRSTDDVDLALQFPKEMEDIERVRRITAVTSKLPFESISPAQEFIVEIRAGRYGASRPTFRVYIDEKGSDEEVLAMNINRGQPSSLNNLDDCWYNEFINQGHQLSVPYSDSYSLSVRVPRIEHILATKIANSRAKDLMDNKNLVDLCRDLSVSLDIAELGRVLLPVHEDKYGKFIDQYTAVR